MPSGDRPILPAPTAPIIAGTARGRGFETRRGEDGASPLGTWNRGGGSLLLFELDVDDVVRLAAGRGAGGRPRAVGRAGVARLGALGRRGGVEVLGHRLAGPAEV